MNKKFLFLGVSLLLLAFSTTTWAVPRQINVQGKMQDANGAPVGQGVPVNFAIYDAASAGNVLWAWTTDTTALEIDENGIFNTYLGNPHGADLPEFTTDNFYLEITVDNNILSPRERLVAVPFAITARNVFGGSGNLRGNLQIGAEGSDAYIKLSSDELLDATGAYIWSENAVGLAFGTVAGTPNMYIDEAGNVGISGSRLHVGDDGNVGVGTATPLSKLSINGEINITGNRLYVGTNGRVGIGTGSPASLLHVKDPDDGNVNIQVEDNDGYWATLGINDVGNYAALSHGKGSANYWDTIVMKNGKVGIGTTTPDDKSKLDVNGSLYVNGITCSGSIVCVNLVETSDKRLKKNPENLNNVLGKIKDINGIKYDWRTDEFPDKNLPKEKQIGIIAQEVELHFPELVNTDDQGYKSLSYDKFTAVLLEAIKEQQKQIEALQQKVDELERK